MAETLIEWCDRVWNFLRGCTIISPGCVNCYAMKQARRFSGPGRTYEGLTKLGRNGPQWTGKIRVVEEKIAEPLHVRTPAKWFVNSMSDLFHAVEDEDGGRVQIEAQLGLASIPAGGQVPTDYEPNWDTYNGPAADCPHCKEG